MTTDKELLELAAKAVGLDVRWHESNGHDYSPISGFYLWKAVGNHGLAVVESLWSPLSSDGDALRLAVRLRMNFRMEMPYAVSAGWREQEYGAPTADGLGPWFWKEWLSDHKDDAVAATRRAIVRAAAELGKAKP